MRKSQAMYQLSRMGLMIRAGDDRHEATLIPIKRQSFAGECRDYVVRNSLPKYLWPEVVSIASSISQLLEPCPHPEGKCPFHDGVQ